ncbi:hypothetical protein BYT27DRAFT_7085351, partial [Phlegmacium glaucopus]
LQPNTPYVFVTLENSVITGGFYLSTHTLFNSLMGLIHTFVLPSLLTEGKNPPFTIFIRRLVHYLHNSFILNDFSDRDHLPTFSSLDGVRDLFALFSTTVFLNVLDDRTYQFLPGSLDQNEDALQQCQDAFDLNAIPVVKRHHLCYIQGLALDLIHWFFDNYTFSDVNLDSDDVDGYMVILVPFTVHIGRQIIRYI